MTIQEFRPDDFIIESLWILDRKSGLCIFEEIYEEFTKKGIDTDLIASFLSAILSFAGEAFTEEIEFIKFTNRKIIFEFSEYALFVIAVDERDKTPEFQIKGLIKELAYVFNSKYQSYLEKELVNNTALFDEYSGDLIKIVKKDPISDKACYCLKNECVIHRAMKKLKILRSKKND